MSYLKEASADETAAASPPLSKAIISIWVKTDSKGPDDKWNEGWLPESLDKLIDNNNVMFSGGNYWTGINGAGTVLQPAHLWVWPPGPPEALGLEGLRTFKDGMTPFISWGERHAKYKRVKWEKRVLRGDYWIFGRGGKANNLISQYPAPVGAEEGVVPPSCIGVHRQTGKLRIILQTKSHATYRGYAYTMSKAKCVFIQTPLLPVGGFGNAQGYKDFANGNPLEGAFVGNAIWYDDVSSLEFGQHPETFIMDTDDMIADGQWHHIVLAWDFSGGGSGSSGGNGGSQEVLTGEAATAPAPDGSLVTVEGQGEKACAPLPGTYGQYSGADGDIALAPLRYVAGGPQGPDGTYTCEQLTGYGAPFEDNGTGTGPCTRGRIVSTCKAWLYVDGKKKTGRELHHAGVWSMVKNRQNAQVGEALSALEGSDTIVPVNALVALTGDPRLQIVTSQTAWERHYRTLFGAFLGPRAIIDVTDEPRRFSYAAPKYALNDAVIPRAKFTIPAGEVWNDLKWNLNVKIAELFIWTEKGEDPGPYLDMFIKDGEPPPLGEEWENRLGRPNVKLHFSSNWRKGKNTGSDGYRITGDGEEKTEEIIVEGQYSPTGRIDRWMPDPKIGGSDGGS
jgi:hypothetical protein